ncbi:hypothetical protein JNUCC1_01364 [Lentibacillus sp. JNUCC-1]|uniref:hypothetical protein n=1 Tax=Lentibacillus sp. JNUCC-1 TaxID=2654513 RepID=UPI0013256227|nr:hypothetical protein [Lentibacillus sp. JNUCC-1]MUV37558.1 hypothetical protein [Lentibacillus sp. JNUCC-1]
MYCRECGNEVGEHTDVCPNCGVRPLNSTNYCQSCGVETKAEQELCVNCGARLKSAGGNVAGTAGPDEPSALINVASCCVPILGLILYIVWKDEKPLSAKSAGKWAIAGTAIVVGIYILFFVFTFFLAMLGSV